MSSVRLVLQILFKHMLYLAFPLAYSYIYCIDTSSPASSYDANTYNQDQHPALC